MKEKFEILAPAGSYESMVAAVNAGADAVYIGGSRFGARAYANNLDEETMVKRDRFYASSRMQDLYDSQYSSKKRNVESVFYLKPYYEADWTF